MILECDLESRKLNMIKPKAHTEKIVADLEEKMVLHSVAEARTKIHELIGIVKGKSAELQLT